MLITEKGSLTKEGINEESDEHTIATDNNTVPLNELLVNSTAPTTAVAIKVCDVSADETGRSNNEKQKRGILSNFQRRTFSRISFKGETGPLLSSGSGQAAISGSDDEFFIRCALRASAGAVFLALVSTKLKLRR
ncbi:hypothetical protein K0M31_006672 [Melipona bicolor]|uniref:Uncharacterized protein n=1 Tax=Melipona bicolor TaxID=60889 RepID=A0AA40FS04_9HYME|nr:hypothetical protein K0M31_006672 [Melipona bicolor]